MNGLSFVSGLASRDANHSASAAVLALVCGLPRDLRGRRRLAMLRAFVDDSGRGNPPIFVLAALVARAAAWAAFSDEWDEILGAEPRMPFLKMKELMNFDSAAGDSDRLHKLYALQGVINRHVEYGVVIGLPSQEYRKIFKGVTPLALESEYFFAATHIIEAVLGHEYDSGRKEKVSFVFDEQMKEQTEVLSSWNYAKNGGAAAPIRRRMGGTPTWDNDRDLRPLQAADMIAWLCRRLGADMVVGANDVSVLSSDPVGAILKGEAEPPDYQAVSSIMASKAWSGGRNLHIPIHRHFYSYEEMLAAKQIMDYRGYLLNEPESKKQRAIRRKKR